MSNNDLDYLISHQSKFEDKADKNYAEANEIFRELVRQLILVATVFLSISALIFTSPSLILDLNIPDKHFLALAWISIALSIFFGILQYFIDKLHFEKWGDMGYKIALSISISEIDTKDKLLKIITKYRDSLDRSSSVIPAYLQVGFLILGLILLIITMINLLF